MTAVITTKRNPRGRRDARPPYCTSFPSTVQGSGRPPVASGRPDGLADAILAEFHIGGIPASYAGPPLVPRPGGRSPVPGQPIIAGSRDGAEAIIVVIDRSLVESLFGESYAGRMSLRSLLRAARVRSCENQLCETATTTALAARRLLIVCDAARTSMAERKRAIRWVREAAHRIGYECSINGLHNLGTSYLILVADAEVGSAARSVVDWYRRAGIRI